jgi:hypothetical protein
MVVLGRMLKGKEVRRPRLLRLYCLNNIDFQMPTKLLTSDMTAKALDAHTDAECTALRSIFHSIFIQS